MLWLKTPKKKLSIPDWLSLYRILSVPILIAFILLDKRLLFGTFLLISFLTDSLDGFLARRWNIVSQRGSQLDSIGDAIAFTVGLVGIFHFETAFFYDYIILILAAFGFYVVQLLAAYIRYGMPSSFHTYLAKLSAVIQGVFMIWIFYFGVELWLFYLVLTFSVLETIEEIILIILFPKWKSDVKGLIWVMIERKRQNLPPTRMDASK